MSALRTVATVDVWRDYEAGLDDKPYSVSVCNDDGDEIRCLGGGTLAEAWEMAREYADEHGVSARRVDRSHRVLETYDPEQS